MKGSDIPFMDKTGNSVVAGGGGEVVKVVGVDKSGVGAGWPTESNVGGAEPERVGALKLDARGTKYAGGVQRTIL